MDFGQFYVDKVNSALGDLFKEKMALQIQCEFVIKRTQELEEQVNNISKELEARSNNIISLERELEKTKKKLQKMENGKESSQSLNNGTTIEISA